MFDPTVPPIPDSELPPSLAQLRERYSSIYAIVSPPRCSSTAFARVFWEHPEVRFYAHEPFEVTYYVGRDLTDVVEKLSDPLDLQALEGDADSSAGQALVVKEMPYQVGRRFPLLVALADSPIIFLMRDPRLNIASRMAKKREVGDSPVFPFVETGWELLSRQITWCREHGVPHLLVDSTDFRNRPREVFPQVFEQLGLEFDDGMLQWRARPEVELDNLGGLHRHLYDVALGSTGIRSETASIPPLEAFPRDGGWREHVERCLAIYRELGGLEARLSAEPRTTC